MPAVVQKIWRCLEEIIRSNKVVRIREVFGCKPSNTDGPFDASLDVRLIVVFGALQGLPEPGER
jgi:hypothetical protein